MVLEIEHELLGNMTLTLGRYHKALDDNTYTIPEDIKTYRANVRAKSNEM